VLVRSVRTSYACNFQDMWKCESQPRLQLVKKLATSLFWYSVYEKVGISSIRKSKEIDDFYLTVIKDQKV